MPLPTLTKTYEFNHGSNSLSGVQKTDIDNTFLLIKTALKSGTVPCTVSYSCNSVAAGTVGDGVDRITSSATIVNNNAGSVHSWLVMNLVGMGSAQLLLAWDSTGVNILTFKFSPGGLFTGGSTTANPTATDSLTLSNGAEWAGVPPGGLGGQYRTHVERSTDGKNTRVFVCGNGAVTFFMSFETPVEVVSGWTLPYIAAWTGRGNGWSDGLLLQFSNWVYQPVYKSMGPASGGTAMPLTLTSEGKAAGSPSSVGNALNIPNEISGEYTLCPPGLWHETTTGQKGRHGMIPDMYFTAQGSVTGDTFPADGSKQFVQMGAMVVPSDGTTWLIS